jgi:phenylpropionate dioxygenase-like ring-hydroxylating dioxygenase large terminal subunit
MTLDAIGERALVIRGKDRVLRAFHNVCRHRASRVVLGEAGNCAGVIACPYHGWSYDFDGKLRAVPAEKTFSNLERDQMALMELELEQWMGIVFVRFAGSGPSVESTLKEFDDEAGQYRIEDMKPWGRPVSLIENFNWKFFCENDAEGYHVPEGHPGLRRLFGTSYEDCKTDTQASRSQSTLQERPSSNWVERSYQHLLPEVAHLPENLRRAWIYYGFNPNFSMQLTPDLVDCYQVLPMGPDRCKIEGFSLALDDDRPPMRAARYLNQRLTRQVVKEDIDFCQWTDGGLRTSGYPGGVLSELEFGVRGFQDWIRELLPVANRTEAPPTGMVSALNDGMKGGH